MKHTWRTNSPAFIENSYFDKWGKIHLPAALKIMWKARGAKDFVERIASHFWSVIAGNQSGTNFANRRHVFGFKDYGERFLQI